MPERNSIPCLSSELGAKLRQMRQQAGLTLEEAAFKLHKSRSSLHRRETGFTKTDIHRARSMMDLYDIYDPASGLRVEVVGLEAVSGVGNEDDEELGPFRLAGVLREDVVGARLLDPVLHSRAVRRSREQHVACSERSSVGFRGIAEIAGVALRELARRG